ncbi:MAG: cell division protein ZapE [Pseudomonadota bacterium]
MDTRSGTNARPRHRQKFCTWIEAHAHAEGYTLDCSQISAVERFERLHADLMRAERSQGAVLRLFTRKREVRGIYLWRGKSFLMDSFYGYAQIERKQRIHFHRFMQQIHQQLHRHQGQADPLREVARDIANDARLLCLDEFHITDITDAMLMKRLLQVLFDERVVVVTTSNFEPDALYLHGLQRSQFLPAIELIKDRLEIINVDAGNDYRLRELEKAGVYHIEADADAALERAFMNIAHHESEGGDTLEIEGRLIHVRRHARGIAWFDFAQLCDGPRGKPDYIELARRYHTVVLSNVPRFRTKNGDVLRRFVWLIDEFYDRRVKLIISASAPPEQLVVTDEEEGDAFQANLNASLNERLVSRLTEMQTRDYLAQPHLP